MRTISTCVVMAVFLIFSGCQSHQAKVANLQKQYDDLAKQFQQDCSAEYLDIPPKISPKCKDEDTRMKDAWNRLQSERSTK